MSDSLDYDEREARREERIYETPAAAQRRQSVRTLLALRPGERVLSIGCGPGFEPAELAPAVGETGHVHAVDRSEAMVGLAARRCVSAPQVTLSHGDATALPVTDGAVDAAAAIQVYEYVTDVDAALNELRRVLRPGGRAVVCDADFASLVWRSTDTERTRRILDAFDDHCPWPRLGSRLSPRLRDAGLTVERVEPNTILNTRLDENTFAYQLMQFLEAYAADHDDVEVGEPAAWVADLEACDQRGETFFSFTQYLHLVRAPE